MAGFGLALAQPDRPVMVLTGDGEMLMALGALATIGQHNPGNLAIVVLDNTAYGETGAQVSHTATTDLVGVAAACGIAHCERIEDQPAVDDGLAGRLQQPGKGTLFSVVRIASAEVPRAIPIRDSAYVKAGSGRRSACRSTAADDRGAARATFSRRGFQVARGTRYRVTVQRVAGAHPTGRARARGGPWAVGQRHQPLEALEHVAGMEHDRKR
ncbi:MAG: thiamine pyrophosphate-dependent enzyme [Burkholderiaceae bacterium]